jgi:uncharacterized membrane protein required for colicin V production
MHPGTIADAVIVLFLLLQTWLGWRRGLLWQAAGVASVLFGMLLGWVAASRLGDVAERYITTNPFRAKLLVFLLVMGIVGLALRVLAGWAEVRSEQGVPKNERDRRRAGDRILGGMFGALKGCVLALVLVSAAASFFPNAPLWPRSRLAAPLARAGLRVLPEGAARDVAHWAGQSAADMRKGLEMK